MLPPLLDYPNHLARMYLLPHLPDAALARYYTVHWTPIPDLAMDGIVPFLAKVMPLEWAGKLFIALTFLLLAGGTGGDPSCPVRPLVALVAARLPAALYAAPALGLHELPLRLRLGAGRVRGLDRARRRHWLLRLVLGTVFAVAIYFRISWRSACMR